MLSAAPTPQHHAQRRIVIAKPQSYEVNAQAFHSCAFFNRLVRSLGSPIGEPLLFFRERKVSKRKQQGQAKESSTDNQDKTVGATIGRPF